MIEMKKLRHSLRFKCAEMHSHVVSIFRCRRRRRCRRSAESEKQKSRTDCASHASGERKRKSAIKNEQKTATRQPFGRRVIEYRSKAKLDNKRSKLLTGEGRKTQIYYFHSFFVWRRSGRERRAPPADEIEFLFPPRFAHREKLRC